MGTPHDDQMQVLRWLQEREVEGGDPFRIRDNDVMAAFGWTEAKAKAVLRVLKQRGDIEQNEVLTDAKDGYSALSIRLTAQGHRRLDPQPATPTAVNLIQNTGTMGPVQQGGQDNVQHATVFEVAKEDKAFLEKASRFFLKFLGAQGTIVFGWISTVAGATGTIVGFASDLDSTYSSWLFPGIGLWILGLLMIRAYKQRKRSQCKACGMHYGLQEVGAVARDIRLDSSLTRVERTTTRTYRCRSCGNETQRTSTRTPEE